MPRRKTSRGQEDHGPTYLVKPVVEVASELDDRIKMGQELQRMLSPSGAGQLLLGGQLDEAKSKYRMWQSYNVTYLERAFSTNEIANDYSGAGMPVIGTLYTSDVTVWRELGRDVHRDVRYLISLFERLKLYEASEPRIQAPAQMTQRAHLLRRGPDR